MMDRRKVMFSAGAPLLLMGLSRAADRWDSVPVEQREHATSVPDRESIDYAQLPFEQSHDTFVLSDESLARLFRWHGMDHRSLGTRILFGLRGAHIVGSQSEGFAPHIELKEASVDYENLRCVIGVWTPGQGIWLTAGSTVPNILYMYAQRREIRSNRPDVAQSKCNLMASGLYWYRVGTHRNWTTQAQPGAFRQASMLPVVRLMRDGDLAFTRRDAWAVESPNLGENIHAGLEGRGIAFFSAGCQIVPGNYSADRRKPMGPWRSFRIAAGLAPDPVVGSPITDDARCIETSEDLLPSCAFTEQPVVEDHKLLPGLYAYFLGTGREARIASTYRDIDADPQMRRLRRGAQGNAVSLLQQKMLERGSSPAELDITGVFDWKTQRALILNHQLPLTGGADGVVTAIEAEKLGFPGIFG